VGCHHRFQSTPAHIEEEEEEVECPVVAAALLEGPRTEDPIRRQDLLMRASLQLREGCMGILLAGPTTIIATSMVIPKLSIVVLHEDFDQLLSADFAAVLWSKGEALTVEYRLWF